MANAKTKEALYGLCCDFIDDRFKTIQKTISEIQESLTSETKSSAGDKHETGRAMLQLEREKAGNQWSEIQKTKEILDKVNVGKVSKQIGLGSVVYTSQANYFIAISAGVLKVEQDHFYAISSNTPIGKLLMGHTVNDVITFRDQNFTITGVF
ncbi:3-oxoacyl-ACP synthase [Tamlana sp. s12]|uniref:3-oxoacyl-ACP synthase n=1 Tax=Tamlana sp. s12 TaxID=1630406 RepID=UPI0007FF71E7|nr:3-oxoacyl-ACP synthase [Tamlana sp. s12]OBQ51984.1 3-oxoacyl-ACP synthase [Tamlana sp. s12]QQY82946.1 3-oxoacyl-ACP synthase [Tamlana sp. s12]